MTNGVQNTFVGGAWNTNGAGYHVTTGSKNTIIGGYDGNQGSLDLRTSTNNTVISNGDGTRSFYSDGATNTAFLNGAQGKNSVYGTSIQSFDGNTMGALGVWTTMWNIPQGSVGLLTFNVGFGSYGGSALFFISYGNSVAGTAAMATLASNINDQGGYSFAYRISGTNFQVQNNTNGVAFVPRLNFLQLS
jgi:hypothetical protein